MKRLWISVGLIALLAILATAHLWVLGRYTVNLGRQLELVQSHLYREDWENAAPLLRSSYEQWEDKAFYLHTTLRHEDIDAIRTSFREALSYLPAREDAAECAAIVGRLRNQLELLLEAELPTVKNLL